MEILLALFSALGSFGLFYFGLKTFSESFQVLSGPSIRQIIQGLKKSDRFGALFGGLSISFLVQGESVALFMIVGLVNAGLMALPMAISVIFGANIGATILGWLFSMELSKYSLLIMALGLLCNIIPYSLKFKELAKVLFGLALIFFSLNLLGENLLKLQVSEVLDSDTFILLFSNESYSYFLLSLLVFLIGFFARQSLVILALVMAFATSGIVDFFQASLCLVVMSLACSLGDQVFQTNGNVIAKRTRKAGTIYAFFNFVFSFLLIKQIMSLCVFIIPGNPSFHIENGIYPNVAIHLAFFHTFTHLCSALLLVPFVRQITSFVSSLHPHKEMKEQTKLEVLSDQAHLIPATALVLGERELQKLKDIVDRMYDRCDEYIKSPTNLPRVLAKIKDYERITDNIYSEISRFILKLMESPLSDEESKRAQVIMESARELESIADYLDKLITSKTRFCENALYEGEIRTNFMAYHQKVKEFYLRTTSGIIEGGFLDELLVKEDMIKLKSEGEKLREEFMLESAKNSASPYTVLAFSDMVTSAKKIRSHSMELLQANIR